MRYSTALWYTSRATGVVCLVLLSVVVVLGVLVNRQVRLPGLPRFAVTGLHRSVSLLALAFVGVHVVSAVADPYVPIRLVDSITPFVSAYRPFWIGLGAISFDLLLSVIATSLLRRRVGRRTWWAVHRMVYLAWPVALIHGLGISSDLQSGWLLGLTVGCTLAVAVAVGARMAHAARQVPRWHRPAALLAALGQHGYGSSPSISDPGGGFRTPWHAADTAATQSRHRANRGSQQVGGR